MYKKHILIIAIALCIAVGVTFAICIASNGSLPSREVGLFSSDDERCCLLVTGKDRVSGLTDVIMLVSLDSASSQLSVMQIPRDTYAEYGNEKHRKLNGALASLGGEAELKKYFEDTLGLKIDGYLSLDLDGFAKIVDTVGGVEMDVEEPLYYNDPEQNLHIAIESGRQILDGRTAEMFVRYRSGYVDGDIGRLDAQKKFLSAFFCSLKQKVNIKNAYSLACAVVGAVKTDVKMSRAVSLALKALTLDESSLRFFTLPGEAVTSKKTGASFYVMSADPTRELLCEYFGREDESEIDEKRLFAHPEYEDFIKIYEAKTKNE